MDPVLHPAKSGEPLPSSAALQGLKEWALREGICFPKLNYPVRFPPGYVGSQALETIGPNEVIVSAPKRMLLMAKDVDTTELAPIIAAHPELFDWEQNSWYDDFRLILFMIFERHKGDSSYWYYFLETLPKELDTVLVWTVEELTELQDPMLVRDAKERLQEVRQCWCQVKSVLKQYPALFTNDMLTFEEFLWAQQIVASRAFGKSVPSTSLCPIAEFLNHDTVQTYYIYGPPSLYCPKILGLDDGDDQPSEADHNWPVPYVSIAVLVKRSRQLQEKDYITLEETATSLDNQRRIRAQEATWRPMEFEESDENTFRIMTGPSETYEKGAEVYLRYGADSNRHLLIYYGFSLPRNIYNYEYLVSSLSDLISDPEVLASAEELGLSQKWSFKIREREICMDLIRTMRALRWQSSLHELEACLNPTSFPLELEIFGEIKRVLEARLSRFPTTMEQDSQKTEQSMRIMFAREYRRQRKLAIHTQMHLLDLLTSLIQGIQAGNSLENEMEKLNETYENLGLLYKDMLAPYLEDLESSLVR